MAKIQVGGIRNTRNIKKKKAKPTHENDPT